MSLKNVQKSDVLFIVGVIGIIFYVVAPALFPDTPNLRQPELLPVYTLMLGLGQLLRSGSPDPVPPADAPAEEPK